MAKYVLINVHTERLADDKVWLRARKLARALAKKKKKAVWFVLNPEFVCTSLSAEDKAKWRQRLKTITDLGQTISQHSHFYRSYKGKRQGKEYDLSLDNISEVIAQDKQWLESQGFTPKGFLSGAWKTNQDVFTVLKEQGFKYDVSVNNLKAEQNIGCEINQGILRIPATATVKRLFFDLITFRLPRRFFKTEKGRVCALHLHDYDLKNTLNFVLLKVLLFSLPLLGIKIIDIESFYEIQ